VVVVVAAAVWKWVVEFKELDLCILVTHAAASEWESESDALDETQAKKYIRKIDFNYLSKKYQKKKISKKILRTF